MVLVGVVLIQGFMLISHGVATVGLCALIITQSSLSCLPCLSIVCVFFSIILGPNKKNKEVLVVTGNAR